MALRQNVTRYVREQLSCSLMHVRCFKSDVDWKKLRPMILKRIESRAKYYPLKSMIPVAYDVLEARRLTIEGVSALLKVLPAKACKYCPEVYISNRGHHIKSCHGFKRIKKDQGHKWVNATVNDIIPPVEAFHLQTLFQPIVEHEQRFDFDRIPAVVELCYQAGAKIPDELLHNHIPMLDGKGGDGQQLNTDSELQDGQLSQVGRRTLDAWERLRVGVQKLLSVYRAKVCEHCAEVHIGPSGHKARVCGVFKYEGWRGAHHWKKAEVDDLVPLKVVWHRRPHDPQMLVDSGRGFYGHAPAVVELCMQAGAWVPKKYTCMMKLQGLAPDPLIEKGAEV